MTTLKETRQAILSSVLRRFPEREFNIRRMMEKDQTFFDLCEELAVAEDALANVDQFPPAIRSERRAEWQDLVDRLAKEIDGALQNTRNRI
ncbi:hydrogenase maturation factor [Rhizobium sp. BK529]|uniref:hypothetical protein n=1 Tax=unclassified Rhizobium TaxID=2613769 RepID=UPI0010460913|nr:MULTISPECIES: hypothetical protein [unclassified Rhizobium]MBB3589906.1 hydrogenase maturation factor [Rhizobium sp. BK529]TCS04573.1 hypothetical protein EV281_103248 [Rhizobium sp. BK418]